MITEHPHGAQRDQVVVAEDRVRGGPPVQQFLHRLRPVGAVEGVGGDHQRRIVREPGGAEGLAIAVGALRRRTLPAALMAQGRDPAPALLDQVPGRGRRGGDVVDADMINSGPGDQLAQQHHRRRVPVRLELRPRGVQRAEQDPVHHPRIHPAGHEPFGLRVTLGLIDQHGVAAFPRRLHDMADQLGEIRHVDLGHRERDQPAAAEPEVAGAEIGPIAELVDRPAHPFLGRRAHRTVAGQDVGHRGRRDLGQGGHLPYADGADRRTRTLLGHGAILTDDPSPVRQVDA